MGGPVRTGTYGTPPVTRTDSGSGQLIVPPRRYLFAGKSFYLTPALGSQINLTYPWTRLAFASGVYVP